MSSDKLEYTTLFDEQGKPFGVLVSPELWERLRDQADALTGRNREPELPPEPLDQWNVLVRDWDFKYPVDLDVACECCGTRTDDWLQDEPRKFRLTAANFTGIVSFQCQTCKAKIIKRHFTDKIKVETRPYQETKTYRFDAFRGR